MCGFIFLKKISFPVLICHYNQYKFSGIKLANKIAVSNQ